MADIGKKFETRFKTDWLETVPGSFIYRLNDQMSGYMGSSNISDFICYNYPDLFLIECKEHKQNTFPFSAFRQYEGLTEWVNIKGVHPGVILWMSDHDKVIWVPITTFMKLREENKVSFNIKMLNDPNYETLEIPSKKLRSFMKSDYSALINYYKES